MKIGRLRIVWIVLVLLAAFVVFVECIAEAGGGDVPLPRPLYTPPPAAPEPLDRALPALDWQAAFTQSADSSSNTWLPLS